MNEDFFKKNMKDLEDFLKEADIQGQPIPARLHSVYSEGPFETCVGCGESLLHPPRLYEIQKVYRGKEVIFEYALCDQCGGNLMKEYSKESMEALQKHISENFVPVFGMDTCHLCQSDKREEYVLMSLCKGESMISFIVMCQTCMDGLENLLSKKTRDTMKDFVEDKFPGIPAEFNPVPILNI